MKTLKTGRARFATRFSIGLIALLTLATSACGGGMTAAEAQMNLSDSDAAVRLKASRTVEGDAKEGSLQGPVIDQLVGMASTESDRKVKGSVMIALGYTGDPRAKPLIEAYLQTTDKDEQRWATRAWSWYLIRTGKYPEGHKFPAKFPYGTEGYPEPAE